MMTNINPGGVSFLGAVGSGGGPRVASWCVARSRRFHHFTDALSPDRSAEIDRRIARHEAGSLRQWPRALRAERSGRRAAAQVRKLPLVRLHTMPEQVPCENCSERAGKSRI
jgi:hypothetical protein